MALGALLGAELDYCWGATGLILEHALGTAMHLTDARSGTRRDGALGQYSEPLGPAPGDALDRSSVGSWFGTRRRTRSARGEALGQLLGAELGSLLESHWANIGRCIEMHWETHWHYWEMHWEMH
jgi:hypothetical protein